MAKDPQPGPPYQSGSALDQTTAEFRDLIRKMSKEVALPEPTQESRAAITYHDRITAELAVGAWTVKKSFFEGPLDTEELLERSPTPQQLDPSPTPRQQTGQAA